MPKTLSTVPKRIVLKAVARKTSRVTENDRLAMAAEKRDILADLAGNYHGKISSDLLAALQNFHDSIVELQPGERPDYRQLKNLFRS